ncbi:MAG: hypothetical protein H6767_10025 [Candidatus Peribacteria bacterium]|nr:MAG: hypothetical protein H6767_10025 [Candidatus Peribacteria bacterium]
MITRKQLQEKIQQTYVISSEKKEYYLRRSENYTPEAIQKIYEIIVSSEKEAITQFEAHESQKYIGNMNQVHDTITKMEEFDKTEEGSIDEQLESTLQNL